MFADLVYPFSFERLPVRGEIVCLTASWQRMLETQSYPQAVRDVLGEATAATVLIAQGMKFDGNIALQIQGSGELRMLVAQCTSELTIRGLAHPVDNTTATSFAQLTENAHCAVTVDAGERPYQGIVEVDPESLASSLERYFERSVQIPSHVSLHSDGDRAGGILLQQLPGQAIDEDDWHRLGLMARTLTLADLARDDGMALLGKLFAEDDVRVHPSRKVAFRCGCSQRKTEDVLRMLGEDEVTQACKEQGFLSVTCEYCGEARRFDAVDIRKVFTDNVIDGTSSLQ